MANVNRRQMLGLMGGAAIAGIGVAGLGIGEGQAAAMPVESKRFSWTPRIVDPNAVQAIARDGFYDQGLGCAYGVFYSIIGTMGKQYGAPYNAFPFSMMEFGKSGVSEWGTLCGALTGAAATLALFWGRKERDPMVDELFRWYETTTFPIYKPQANSKIGLTDDIPTSVATSVLCHISISRWAYQSGLDAGGAIRSERCSRLTADVAKKTVEIMNAKINGTFKKTLAMSDTYKTCTDGCHGPSSDKYLSATVKSKMDCAPCHTGSEHVMDKLKNHP